MIDCYLRKADYAKFYTDIDMATDDYQNAIKICQKFVEGNERIMSSAYFSLGSLYLDKSDRITAKLNFDHAIRITQDILMKYLKEKGQCFETEVVEIKKLIEPSIFDDQTIQDLKATLVEMVEFVKECQDMEKMQPELDKMKAEAQK
jgi:tetratricopeptide (TPR) repeat protein